MVLLAVVLVLLVIGSLVFHFASPWTFTPIASHWTTVDDTVNITFIVCGIVFVAVNLFTAYCVWRFRHREGQKAHYEPESKKLEIWLTAITSVGVAAMLTPGLFVWGKFVTVPDDAMTAEALGKQWHWSFRFPGADNVLGASDVRHLSVDNPLGIDPDDPDGQDDIVVAAPIVHVPMGQPVEMLLRSTDVLHNFAVPQFRVKMDLVPGTVTYQWFTPTVPGTYELLCEELCGVGHFAMRGKVVIDTPEDFAVWLDAQPTFAETQARPVGNATAGAATFAVCSACHGMSGEGNVAMNAPKIAGLEPWYTRRQMQLFRERIRGDEDDQFGMLMAPMAQTVTDETALENLLAYIDTLPDRPAPESVTGDANRGRALYTTCAVCHGRDGAGRWATNAPRLEGMSDWYLVRQLENFKSLVRGGHPQDVYGDQMHLMASTLSAEGAIEDVVAYINTL
jgi:cytochrome c oxidase subunit 2